MRWRRETNKKPTVDGCVGGLKEPQTQGALRLLHLKGQGRSGSVAGSYNFKRESVGGGGPGVRCEVRCRWLAVV
jgi:hypothetical protein